MSVVMGGLAILGSTSALGQTDCRLEPAITSCTQDETTTADLTQLRRLVRNQFAPLGGEGPDPARVNIKFIGKGRTANFVNQEPLLEATATDGTGPGRRITAWRMFNPATKNEFEIEVPEEARETFDAMLMRGDPKPEVPGGLSPERPTSSFNISAWSGGVDDRVRRTEVDSYPWSTVADMGGCTATFVGPRHIVTAGHCIYNRGSAATASAPAVPASWSTSFTVRPQRDANSIPYSTSMPPGPGQEGWYFTPVGWRQANPDGGAGQFDFAIVVVPDRLGDQVSWMGYGALGAAELQQGSPLMLRGYPFCESETSAPGERIDEPVVPGQPAPDFGCVKNGFYVGSNCSVGAFAVKDPDGWNRRVDHGCDASAANSGSSVYVYFNGDPMVVGIHTTSIKCRAGANPLASPPTNADAACTASDTHPLRMTRVTPEYRGWISHFRTMFP